MFGLFAGWLQLNICVTHSEFMFTTDRTPANILTTRNNIT